MGTNKGIVSPADRRACVYRLLVVAGLTTVAVAPRLYHADSGLWVDEITSVLDSFRLPLHKIAGAFPADNQHPLYSILARLSMLALGEAAWTVRLPAVLFGAVSVPALYLLGRETVGRTGGAGGGGAADRLLSSRVVFAERPGLLRPGFLRDYRYLSARAGLAHWPSRLFRRVRGRAWHRGVHALDDGFPGSWPGRRRALAARQAGGRVT